MASVNIVHILCGAVSPELFMIVSSVNQDEISNSSGWRDGSAIQARLTTTNIGVNDKAKCAGLYTLFHIHDRFACMFIMYNYVSAEVKRRHQIH